MKRRIFLQNGTSALAGMSLCPFESFAASLYGGKVKPVKLDSDQFHLTNETLKIDLAKASFLKKTGSAAKIAVEMKDQKTKLKIIIVNTAYGFKAFENRCTHGGMELNFLSEKDQLRCTSFGHSKFDMKGNIVKGPAKEKLRIYHLEESGNALSLSLSS